MAFDWSSAQVRDWREDWADMTRPLERFLGPAAEQAMASAMGTAQGDWDEIRQTQRDTLKLRFMVRCIDAAASRVEALAHHAPDWMPLHHALRGQSIAARMHDADGVWAASLHVEQAIQHFAAIAWEPTGLPAPAKLLLKQTMEDAWLNRTECDYDSVSGYPPDSLGARLWRATEIAIPIACIASAGIALCEPVAILLPIEATARRLLDDLAADVARKHAAWKTGRGLG